MSKTITGYHVGYDGRIRGCTANKHPCRLTKHYPSEEAAQFAIDLYKEVVKQESKKWAAVKAQPKDLTPFTAYDKIRPAQYEYYPEYAQQTPGPHTVKLAWSIQSNSAGDNTIKELYENLIHNRNVTKVAPSEHSFIIVRSKHGDTFDLYYLGDDNKFINCEAGIVEEKVIPTANKFMKEESERLHIHSVEQEAIRKLRN